VGKKNETKKREAGEISTGHRTTVVRKKRIIIFSRRSGVTSSRKKSGSSIESDRWQLLKVMLMKG